ncbi:MAG TPA: recombinase family protein [Solirubrobacteraceae bacterium]|nr:recombinase family protein [Solirubrobacteraceae bacterium]
MVHVAKLLDRECPRCAACVGIKCRDLRHPKKTAKQEHIARGWLDRPCPSCHAHPGQRCVTPSGRQAAEVHRARWQRPRVPAQRYGYASIEPYEQHLDAPQRDALRQAGCVRVWVDRPLHVDAPRARGELAVLLAYLQHRDILVVWRLDRLARTSAQLADLAATLHARKIALCSITEHLDSTRPGGEQLFDAIAAVAHLAPLSGADGAARRDSTRPSARRGGRPPVLDEHAHAAVRAMYDAGKHTIDEIAAQHGVSRPTVYRSLQRTLPSQNGF